MAAPLASTGMVIVGAGPSASSTQYELKVVRESSTKPPQAFAVTPEMRLTLGRASTNDIVVATEKASKRHAEIFMQPVAGGAAGQLQLCVRDTSKNGTGIRPKPAATGAGTWEYLVDGAERAIGHHWQLKVPLRSRKDGQQVLEKERTITVQIIKHGVSGEVERKENVKANKPEGAIRVTESPIVSIVVGQEHAQAKADQLARADAEEQVQAQVATRTQLQSDEKATAETIAEKAREQEALARAQADKKAKLRAEAEAPLAALAVPLVQDEKAKKREKKERKALKRAVAAQAHVQAQAQAHAQALAEAQALAQAHAEAQARAKAQADALAEAQAKVQTFAGLKPAELLTEKRLKRKLPPQNTVVKPSTRAAPMAIMSVRSEHSPEVPRLTTVALQEHGGGIEPLRDMSVSPISAPSEGKGKRRKKTDGKAGKDSKAKKLKRKQ